MVNRILRFFRGYVRVMCEGGLTGTLLSDAMREGLDVFGISERHGVVRFCVCAKDYRRFPRLARKSGCRVRMTGKRGVFISLRRIRYRAQLAAGIAVFCLAFCFCGSRVIAIDVTGDSLIPSSSIMSSLSRCGIYPGAPQAGLDVKLIRQHILLENERLSWASVNLSFGRASVEIKDKADIPLGDNGKEGDCLISQYDAVVTKVDVSGGTAVVGVGDVVQKGQMLASENSALNSSSWVANVRGEVWGNVELEYEFSIPKTIYIKKPTGRSKTVRRLIWVTSSDEVDFGTPPFMQYEELRYRRPIEIFSVKLPVCFSVVEYTEICAVREAVDFERAEDLARRKYSEYEKEHLSEAEILNRRVEIVEQDSEFGVRVCYAVNMVLSTTSESDALENGTESGTEAGVETE